MEELLLTHRDTAQLAAYLGALAVFMSWEGVSTRRPLSGPLGRRWFGNVMVGVVGAAAALALVPLAVTVALVAEANSWGLFHQVSLPRGVEYVLTFIVIDTARYTLHRLMHRVPLLWRLHRLHHADVDVDFSTALRSHPFEFLLIAALISATVFLLGAPAGAAALYEILFTVFAFFAHSNVRLASGLERALGYVMVTPDFHRVHHSAGKMESERNYAILFPWLDWLLSSHVAAPAGGHEGMTLGLAEYRDRKHLAPHRMLVDPFLSPESRQATRIG